MADPHGEPGLSETSYGLPWKRDEYFMNAQREEIKEASTWVKVAEDDLRSRRIPFAPHPWLARPKMLQ
jgi:hypothetical protein